MLDGSCGNIVELGQGRKARRRFVACASRQLPARGNGVCGRVVPLPTTHACFARASCQEWHLTTTRRNVNNSITLRVQASTFSFRDRAFPPDFGFWVGSSHCCGGVGKTHCPFRRYGNGESGDPAIPSSALYSETPLTKRRTSDCA